MTGCIYSQQIRIKIGYKQIFKSTSYIDANDSLPSIARTKKIIFTLLKCELFQVYAYNEAIFFKSCYLDTSRDYNFSFKLFIVQ